MKFIKRLILNLSILMLLVRCGDINERRHSVLYIYPKDKSQTISIFTDYLSHKRFIVVGKHPKLPTINYIELDISNISKLGDELGVCWNVNNHKWEMVNHKAKIIKTNLDTTQYIFRENWFEDKKGIFNANYYRKDNCFTFETLNYSEHFPVENGYVEKF